MENREQASKPEKVAALDPRKMFEPTITDEKDRNWQRLLQLGCDTKMRIQGRPCTTGEGRAQGDIEVHQDNGRTDEQLPRLQTRRYRCRVS